VTEIARRGRTPSYRADGDVFTTGQAAKLLKVAPRTVSKWCDNQGLECYRLPGSTDRRIPRTGLVAFLVANSLPVPPELTENVTYRVLTVGCRGEWLSRLLSHLPESDGYLVTPASDLLEAGISLGENAPDAVLIDFSVGRSAAETVAARCQHGTLVIGLVGEDVPTSAVVVGFDLLLSQGCDPRVAVSEIATSFKRKGGTQ